MLGKHLGKRNSKKWKRERGALAGRGLTSSPLAEAGPAHESAFPLPAPTSMRDGRPHRAAVASRQGSTAAWRARSPRSCSLLPPLPFALIHSPSITLARPNSRSGRATAHHCRRCSELPSLAAPASSFESSATSDSASPSSTSRARSTTLGKLSLPVRARRSELELRRPLGSRGSPPPHYHRPQFQAH